MPNEFNSYDGKFYIRTEITSDEVLYEQIKKLLKKSGFSWKRDPDILKNYPVIAKFHHYGKRDNLEFKSAIHPAAIEITFFQNINFENKAGGYYDFNKISKMPYLTRLRFQWVYQKIKTFLFKSNYQDITDYVPTKAYDAVMHHRWKLEKTHHKYYDNILNCNRIDNNGNKLSDGELRYYYGWSGGYLQCGRVYHNINNMWWVVNNDSSYTNIAAFALFSWQRGLKRKFFTKSERQNKITRLLNQSIQNQNFEKSIIYRDLLKTFND